MIKTLNNTIKQDRTAYKIPRSVQDVIPLQRIFADGIFQFGTKYSRTLRFSDINYAIASKEDKTAMFLGYSEMCIRDSVSALCEQAMFLPMIARNRGSNPWGSTRVAALLHTSNLMCAIHWVSPNIGCVALTDELTAFQNHTVAIPAKQRVIIFAASSYEEILAELDAGQEIQNTRLQSYREVYDCLKLPLFLLPCNGTGCLQLRIMGAPNYRELLAKIILKTHYVSPPANRAMYDALYQSVPFVMAADMNLRRIDAAVETARSDGLSQIVLAALPEQAETVLNRRYRETEKARVFTITDAALRELLGSTAPYTPPDLPFYTSEGSVLDVPPLKAP